MFHGKFRARTRQPRPKQDPPPDDNRDRHSRNQKCISLGSHVAQCFWARGTFCDWCGLKACQSRDQKEAFMRTAAVRKRSARRPLRRRSNSAGENAASSRRQPVNSQVVTATLFRGTLCPASSDMWPLACAPSERPKRAKLPS